MKDFKSYSQNNSQNANRGGDARAQGNGGAQNNGGNQSKGASGDVNATVNMAAMLAKAFNGKSEGQVLQTIIAQAEQGKRDGTLTNADLDNFYNTLAPLLDGFKRGLNLFNGRANIKAAARYKRRRRAIAEKRFSPTRVFPLRARKNPPLFRC